MNTNIFEAMYKYSDWVMRLVYVNILWILFTVMGIGIIGFFPATVAMFAIIRYWIKGETDIPVFQTFWNVFKSSLLKANILGYIVIVGGLLLYLDYSLIKSMNGSFSVVMMLLLLTISFYYLMVTFFLIPVYVHYDIKLLECLKYAFIIGSAYPLRTIYIGFAIFVVYYVTASVPVLILFFSASILSWLIMRFTYVAFEKVELRKSNLTKST